MFVLPMQVDSISGLKHRAMLYISKGAEALWNIHGADLI